MQTGPRILAGALASAFVLSLPLLGRAGVAPSTGQAGAVLDEAARLRLRIDLSEGDHVPLELTGGPARGRAWLVYGVVDLPGGGVARPERVEAYDLDEHGALSLAVDLPAPPGTRVHALIAPAGGPAATSLTNTVLLDRRLPDRAGGTAAVGVTQTGEVLITEFMKDPTVVTDSRGEWIELFNPGPSDIDLTSWRLSDLGSDSHLIQARQPVVIRAGEFMLLMSNDDPFTNGLLIPDYTYRGTTLSNGADEIVLESYDGHLVDMIVYDDGVTWPDLAGRSISLDPSAFDAVLNDNPVWWCQPDTVIHRNNSDRGTPRMANGGCP